MRKRLSMMLTITAVAVMGATLLGSNYAQTQIAGEQLDLNTLDADVLEQVHAMGGLELVMPEAFAAGPCEDLENSDRTVHDVQLTGTSVQLPMYGHTVDEPKTYAAMTFNGQVPGPTVRVTQGDVIKMTLTIPEDEPEPHGNDMHASQMSSANFGAVQPGTSATYCYIAHVPGTFKYHCSGIDLVNMDQHVLSGMYGMTIVDPADGYKRLLVEKTTGSGEVERMFYDADALEFQLQYNQLYLSGAGFYDVNAMFDHDTTLTVVNGISFNYVPNAVHNLFVMGSMDENIILDPAQAWNDVGLKQYQSQLLYIETDQHVRFFIENQGNEPVYFHIVGEILDRVVQGNRVQSGAVETWLIGGSQGAIVDVVFDEPGTYVAVNHDYAAIYTGAATVFVAGDPFGLNPAFVDLGVISEPVPSYAYVLGNPSDAVPPMGMNSIAHPAVNVHGLYTDERAEEIAAEGKVKLWEALVPVLQAVGAI